MTRAFTQDPVDKSVIEACLELASWAPSAGKSQGWHMVGLLGKDTSLYWDAALPSASRESFAFPDLLNAGFVGVVLAEPDAYVRRYSEPDKAHTGLGEGADAWPAPYWTIDASMATMTFLLALEDVGLGALFFAVANERDVRGALHIPDDMQIIGAIAAGHPKPQQRRGRSSSRPRRAIGDFVRWGGW